MKQKPTPATDKTLAIFTLFVAAVASFSPFAILAYPAVANYEIERESPPSCCSQLVAMKTPSGNWIARKHYLLNANSPDRVLRCNTKL